MRTVRYGVQASSTRIVIRVCKRRALVWLRVLCAADLHDCWFGSSSLIFGSTTTAPTLNMHGLCQHSRHRLAIERLVPTVRDGGEEGQPPSQ